MLPRFRPLLWTLLALGAWSQVQAADVGPSNGSLVIIGGGLRDEAILERFFELAGGLDSPVVVIPTAGGGDDYGENWRGLRAFKRVGATQLTLLHTRDRQEADSAGFVEPIRQARGVYFTGGRQWRLADAYLNTRTHRELEALLERGGVIGGSSAGATIQGSYLVRGDTSTNTIMMGDHVEGFGFLRNVGIDQHLLRRNRQFDLLEVIQAHPDLLGIGIDENTAIVVRGDSFDVIGQGYVAIYDSKRMIEPQGSFYFLAPGDRYDLKLRRATRSRQVFEPLERVVERKP